MASQSELALPALALHVVGAGQKLVEVFDAERDVQELRFSGTRPENIVVVVATFGAEEHATVPCHVGDSEFEAVAIEADGLVEIATAEHDVVNQLRRCLVVPGAVLIPPGAAAR